MPENAINLTQYDPWKDTPILGNEPLDLDEYDPWSDTPISEPVQALDLNEYDPWQDTPIEDRYTTYNNLMGKDGYVAQAVDRGEISIGEEDDDRPGHFWQGLGTFVSQFPSIATDVIPMTVYRAYRRGKDVTLEDETSIDRLIRKNIQERAKYKKLSEEERQKKWFRANIPFTNIGIDINLAQAEDVADSLGYSVVNAFATLLGRAVGRGVGATMGPAAPVTTPALGVAAGFASGYYVASGATRDEFVERARDAYLKEVGDKITPETEAGWQARYEMIKSDADWTGFWEAAPETVGNLLMFGIAKLPIKGAVAKMGLAGAVNKLKNEAVRKIGKELINKVGIPAAKLMGMLTEETFTEALTTMKQSEIEYKNGMRDKPLSYLESIVEVLPTVLLTTPILGLGMGGAVKILEKTTGKIVEEKEPEKLKEIFTKMIDTLPRKEVVAIRDRLAETTPDHPALKMFDEILGAKPEEKVPTPVKISPEEEVLERPRAVHKKYVTKTLEAMDQGALWALGREHGLTDKEMDDRSIDQVIAMVADRVAGITAPVVEGQGGGIDVLETIISGIDKTFETGTVTEAPADATRTQAQKLMSAMGGQLTFFEETGESILSTFNGFHDPESKRIFINAKAKNPVLRVLGHEAWHRLKGMHSDLYENVKVAAETNEEVFIDFIIKLNGRRKTVGLKSLKIDNLTEEYLADFAGEMFSKASFWKAINKSNPTFARKIANSLRKIIQDFRRIIAAKPELKKIKQPFENMDQVEKAMSEAFGEAFMREAAPVEAKKRPAIEAKKEKLIETSFTKKKKELGIKSIFDLSPKSDKHKILSELAKKQGAEVLEQYRNVYPSGPIVLSKKQGDIIKGILIHKNVKPRRETYPWQSTWWDERGFSGDESSKTEAEAAKEAYTTGYRTIAKDLFNKLSTKPKFIEGIKQVEKYQKEWAELQKKPKPKVKPLAKEVPSKIRTMRGAIKSMGGINFLQFTGELKEMDTAVKYLSKKDGLPIDIMEKALKDDKWLYPEESLLDVLRDSKNLKRDRVTADLLEKKEHELSEQERRAKKEMERVPEAPPEGEYKTIRAEDLPEGKKLTIIEGKSAEGWDIYVVKEKDPFSITLVDGQEIELKPLDKVQVLKAKKEPKFSVKEDPVVMPPKLKTEFPPDKEARYELYDALKHMQALELRLRAYGLAEPQDKFVEYFKTETEEELDVLTDEIKVVVEESYDYWLERHETGEGWANQILDIDDEMGMYSNPSEAFDNGNVGVISSGSWSINVEQEILDAVNKEHAFELEIPDNIEEMFAEIEDYDASLADEMRQEFKDEEIDEDDVRDRLTDFKYEDAAYGEEIMEVESGRALAEILNVQGWNSPIGQTIADVMATKGFEAWRDNWGGSLEEAEDRIKEQRERLEQADTPGKKVVAINLALNENHVYGTMSEHLDISESEMNDLAAMGDDVEFSMLLRRNYKPKKDGPAKVMFDIKEKTLTAKETKFKKDEIDWAKKHPITKITKAKKLLPAKEPAKVAVKKELTEVKTKQIQEFKETEFKDSDEIMSFIEDRFHDKVDVVEGKIVTEMVTKQRKEPKLEISAYHGTGTVFEEFDTGYIGTGEGATAFGWGLYFSSIENIGKHYAEQIGKIGSLYDNFSLFGEKLEKYALADIEDYMSIFRIYVESPTSENLKMIRENAQADLSLYKDQKRMGDESIYHDRMEIVDRKIDFYDKLSKVKEGDIKFPKRQLYKVTLHKGKKPGDYEWLDWYEQVDSSKIKAIVAGLNRVESWMGDKFLKKNDLKPYTLKEYSAMFGRKSEEMRSQYSEYMKDFPDGKTINKTSGEDVYRSLSNMFGLRAEARLRTYKSGNQEASLFLLRAGINGIRYPTETLSGKLGKGFNYVVFDADAISIEDRVSFSLKGPELSPIGKQYMDAFLGKQGEEAPVARSRIRGLLYPWKYVTGKSLASGETVGEILIRKMQDKYIHLKKLQKRLSPTTQLEDKIDVYLSEEVLSGRTTWQLDQFENNYVKPFLDKMLEVGIDVKDLDLYVYAAHAPERNDNIDKKNPDFREKGIPGSGMHTEVANTIIKKYKEKGMLGKLEGLAKILYKINTARIKLLLNAGLITKETHDTVLGTYKRYVPLRGKEGEPDFMGSGRGFSTPSTGLQRALGRKSFAQSPLAWSLGAVEETIVKINKNEVGKSLLGLIREYPDKDLWTIDEVTTKQKWDPVKGEVETVRVPAWAQKDILHVWEDGKRRNVKIKDPLLEKALLNIGSEKMGSVVAALAKFNRYLAMVNTSLNPEFVLSNFVRDIQTAGINLTADQSSKLMRKVMKDVPKALRHAYRGYRGKPGIGDWGKWFKLYRSSGGSIGFFGLRGIDDKIKTIDAMIKRTKKGVLPSARRGISEVGGFITDVNSAVENAVRLASFKNAVESGLTPARAASLSKNLTVNFNRKGELGALMNSFYLFYNAGVQGTARVLQVMTSKTGRRIGAGIAATAFMMTELNRMAGGDDEEDGRNYYDKIPNYVKERSIILMIPGTDGDYIRFPLPYGYNIFWVMGEQTNSALHSGKPVQGAINVLNAAVDAFNPMGGDSSLIRTLSPTLPDVLLDLYMNQNFAGYPIKPEQSQFGLPKPQSWLYWRSVSPISKYIAQKVNRITGGNPIRPGKIDVSPEVLDYLVGTFTGAAGAFINRSLNIPIDLLTGKERAIHKTPFQRVFMGEQTEFYTGGEYRKVTEEIKRRIEEKEEGLPAAVPELSSELRSRYEATEKNVRSTRKRIKEIERSQLSAKRKKELVEEKRKQMTLRQKALIKKFDQEIGGSPWELIDTLNLRKARKKS